MLVLLAMAGTCGGPDGSSLGYPAVRFLGTGASDSGADSGEDYEGRTLFVQTRRKEGEPSGDVSGATEGDRRQATSAFGRAHLA